MPLDLNGLADGAQLDGPPEDTLQERVADCRALSLRLAEPLSDEDQVVQSMADASPTKWHLAHVTWFFEELVLKPHAPGYEPFDERFAYCFNSYYETLGRRHPRAKRGLLTRPSLREVQDYRAHVDEELARFLEQGDEAIGADVAAIIETGIQHEQQHQELLLMDILSVFAGQPLCPAYLPANEIKGPAACELEWVSFDGGLCELGHRGPGFAYDNEGPRHQRFIPPFKLANRPVTNGEWMAFMDDGGYDTATLWLSDGWAKVQSAGWSAPLYWEKLDGQWHQVTLRGGLTPVDPAAPVCHVSYFEADAFARWSGGRLPTEFEWEFASEGIPMVGNFIGSGHFIPVSAADGEGGETVSLRQLFGDVWEWTQSAYAPYPGYQPPDGALGEYNGKFMCNQFVLRGGACVTPDGHVRRTYRNFFYPRQRWQFAGLRLASD